MLRTLLLAVLLTASAARAQDVLPDARTITLQDALRLAQEQSVSLQRAEVQAALAEIGVDDARNAYLPTADLSVSGRQSYGRTFDQLTGQIVDETIESAGANAGIGYTVFDPQRRALLRQARTEQRATELTIERVEQDLVFQVATQFLSVIQASEQVGVRQEALDQQQALLEQIEGLIAGGVRPASEVFQQRAEVAQAQLSVVEGQRSRQIAEANLIQLLQLNPLADYNFVIPELPDLSDAVLTAEALPLGDLLASAYGQRTDLSAFEADIESAELGESIARGLRYPRVNVSAGYGTQWTDRLSDRFSFFDQLDFNRGGSIGLSLNVPLFDAFRTRVAVQRAQVQTANARLTLADQRQQVATQVRQAILDYEAAAAQVAFARVQVASAEEAFRAAEQRYAAGAGTLYDVQQARTLLTNAQSNLVTAQYSFVFQEQLIDYYTGTLDADQVSFDR
jgi:outer membrane protein